MKNVIVPIISVHNACQRLNKYISREEAIDLINGYIKHYHLGVNLIKEDDERPSWKILSQTLDKFPDANKLDFIGQVLDAGYIDEHYVDSERDYKIISDFVKKFNFDDVQQELFNQLSAFSSDAIKTQRQFSNRLKEKYPDVLECWNDSIELFKGGYYSESGEDIRKAFEFLVRDIIGNNRSLENQIRSPEGNVIKSAIGKYLKEKKINTDNCVFIKKLISATLYMSNEKFKHGVVDGLTELDIRFYMNETYLIMQHLMDIADNKV